MLNVGFWLKNVEKIAGIAENEWEPLRESTQVPEKARHISFLIFRCLKRAFDKLRRPLRRKKLRISRDTLENNRFKFARQTRATAHRNSDSIRFCPSERHDNDILLLLPHSLLVLFLLLLLLILLWLKQARNR